MDCTSTNTKDKMNEHLFHTEQKPRFRSTYVPAGYYIKRVTGELRGGKLVGSKRGATNMENHVGGPNRTTKAEHNRVQV